MCIHTYEEERSRRGYYVALSARLSASLLLEPSWKFRVGEGRNGRRDEESDEEDGNRVEYRKGKERPTVERSYGYRAKSHRPPGKRQIEKERKTEKREREREE